MFGNREKFDSGSKTLQIESLRYLREHEPKQFEKLKEDLEGTDLWKEFKRKHG